MGLKSKYPDLKRRVVLQDIKETLERVKEIEGVEIVVQDFWEPQAVQGCSRFSLSLPADSADFSI